MFIIIKSQDSIPQFNMNNRHKASSKILFGIVLVAVIIIIIVLVWSLSLTADTINMNIHKAIAFEG